MNAAARRVEDVSRQGVLPRLSALLRQGYQPALTAAHDDGSAGVRVVHVLLRHADGARAELTVRVARDDAWIPSAAALSYPTGRFEREIRDLFGIVPRDHPLPRRMVRHGHWPTGWHPMLHNAGPPPPFAQDVGSYPFLEVEGPGVYEIPVGPIHAGLIEPGHFRFSVVGETILRMKARLWFVHRGVEKLFEGRRPVEGIELAERISGDTAVGHTLAFAQAVEEAAGLHVTPTDRRVRAVLLELERLHNHVSDLGAILNDVAYGIAHAHTGRLREQLLRLNKTVTGHRLLRGGVRIGGARVLAMPDPAELAVVRGQVDEVVAIALGNSVVLDRLRGTAVLRRDDAERIGALGYVARASGVDVDARRDHPAVDLGPQFAVVVEDTGDVLARFTVRHREIGVSCRIIAHLVAELDGLTGTETDVGADATSGSARAGLGIVEAWRGRLLHRVELSADGTLSRVKVVDPSFMTWPALPVALADTIVPDFPLANKSFNLSYAGNDL